MMYVSVPSRQRTRTPNELPSHGMGPRMLDAACGLAARRGPQDLDGNVSPSVDRCDLRNYYVGAAALGAVPSRGGG